MQEERVSATFEKVEDAERAYRWLRDNDVSEDDIAVVAKEDRARAVVGAEGEERGEKAKDIGADIGKGAAAGAGVGALFGLAALAIPGIGPFITAGWLATALGTTAGTAVSGAIVGGTAGGLAGALTNLGYNRAEAEHYARDVESGMTFLSVKMHPSSPVDRDEAYDKFREFNGRIAES